MSGYLIGQLLSAMSALAFEIILTRVFSLSQWYHFAFMAVSVALLGYGISGTLLAVSRRCRRIPLSWLALGQALSMVAGYLAANTIPFDAYRIGWEPIQLLYLAVYYLSLAAPFVFAGLITARLLSAPDLPAGTVYAANLLGSGLGALCSLAMLPVLAGEGSVVAAAGLAGMAAVGFAAAQDGGVARRMTRMGMPFLVVAVMCLLAVRTPTGWAVRLSPYKSLSQASLRPDAQTLYQKWNEFARVDVLRASGIRSAPGMSLSYTRAPAAQLGLFVDGDNLSPVQTILGEGALEYLDYTPEALLWRLRPAARALVIEPGAGQPLLAARSGGARQIVTVSSNRLIVEAVERVAPAASPFSAPGVELVIGGSRSLSSEYADSFDIVQLPLTDGYRPVRSGAFSLSENYQLTVEAVRAGLESLAPNGIFALTRWLQLPPTESIRAGGIVVEALASLGIDEPAEHIVVIRSWSTSLILARREPFAASELDLVREFCRERQFDLVAYPGIQREEANRYNQLAEPVYYLAWKELLTAPDRDAWYGTQAFDVRPPTDNRPFFFHFFTWRQTPDVLRTLGMTWQPFGGSGYLVLFALLALTLICGAALILLPLIFRRGSLLPAGRRLPTFLLFTLLGVAFMAVEIPLLQQFILLLDQPTYAFAAVLFALLAFSGLGSLLSARAAMLTSVGGAAAAALALALGAPAMIHWLLPAPIGVRVAAAMLMLAPAGLLMGMPLPRLVAYLRRTQPGLIPWAWAVNGAASVSGSVLATMAALAWGFQMTLFVGALAYAGVALIAWPALRRSAAMAGRSESIGRQAG